jgi:nucleotide-binding universal stress UspA family protein
MNIRHVLCPTDLSDTSAHAVQQAVVIASWYKASITAFHVLERVVPSIEGISLDRVRRDVALFFEGAEKAVVPVEVMLDSGNPANQIVDCAARLPADLIVMGTHGTSGFEHLVLGSVTEKVLRKAPCPVLTVPPLARATSQFPFKRLLCAVDFSECSLAALPQVFSLAREADAEVTVLHVIEWPWPEPPAPAVAELPGEQAAALTEYRRYLETTAMARLRSLVPASERGLQPPATRVMSGKPYEQILQVAAEEHVDLIVVGVRGRNPLDMMLFGSTTSHVVRQATCPVLTFRVRAAAGSAGKQ